MPLGLTRPRAASSQCEHSTSVSPVECGGYRPIPDAPRPCVLRADPWPPSAPWPNPFPCGHIYARKRPSVLSHKSVNGLLFRATRPENRQPWPYTAVHAAAPKTSAPMRIRRECSTTAWSGQCSCAATAIGRRSSSSASRARQPILAMCRSRYATGSGGYVTSTPHALPTTTTPIHGFGPRSPRSNAASRSMRSDARPRLAA